MLEVIDRIIYNINKMNVDVIVTKSIEDKLNSIFGNTNNLAYFIIGIGFLIFIGFIILLIVRNGKRKKFRNKLDELKGRVAKLRNHDLFEDVNKYEKLRSDKKVGLLVLKWKKSLEELIKEIDAQNSMLDVLEDALYTRNYDYFETLYYDILKDVEQLNDKIIGFTDELKEYIDTAIDSRKYVDKYFENFNTCKKEFLENKSNYNGSCDHIHQFLEQTDEKFMVCRQFIEDVEYEEADELAIEISRDIKFLEIIIDSLPKYYKTINEQIIPEFENLESITSNYDDEEFALLGENFKEQFNAYRKKIISIKSNIDQLEIREIDYELEDLISFIETVNNKFREEMKIKNGIGETLKVQIEDIEKLHDKAKHYSAIFNIVKGAYNITDNDIAEINEINNDTTHIQDKIMNINEAFNAKTKSYNDINDLLEESELDLEKISSKLDSKLVIINEIFDDEKKAEEKIKKLKEKIDGTKKYVNHANLLNRDEHLTKISDLNKEITTLFKLLSRFPIDIIKLNKLLEKTSAKLENTTKEINSITYKAMLSEYAYIYANRYFNNNESDEHNKYKTDLIQVENAFNNGDYQKAFDRIMSLLSKVNPEMKKEIIEKFQNKFSEMFN
ncbi:septation ring formation regulator EzrA [Haloplasma contractile]|uniref:Septation ring formation regulator protein n=1 Tax=Haloplasma contractile SSD-17B TaxID=1033810 RepID=U2FLL2_9MOLU|nr:septation ring formation regulator EzrA [Haloplasma contractile]ERJ13635.1 Septation ring formation regulator protein [Haloplasma contractile SSD-17B]